MDAELERPTPTIEDYLGAIYALARDGQSVIGRRLADWLEVSPPTVTATLQRMVRDGWVTMSGDKSIELTRIGREMAASVVRRHMLTELLLARVLGMPWSKVHEEADRLEHGLSAETAEAVASIMSDSRLCPHGNPLPGNEAMVGDLTPLLDAEPGRIYTLARVAEQVEREPRVMAFLERNALVPGSRVSIEEVLPFNETVTVRTGAHRVVIGFAVARHIWLAAAGASTS